MALVTFQGGQYSLNEQETVLECLLRHDISIPNSCRSGICQTCLMKMVSGNVPVAAQKGLKPSWCDQQYFLSCVCHPEQDVEVALSDEKTLPHIPVEVLSRENLNNDIVRLKLRCLAPFDYKAGQFIHLQHDEDTTLIRSYSLASVPELDEVLEIHVRRVPDGRMSGWIHDDLKSGQKLLLGGPHGDCYYVNGHQDQGLLLLATGSGLAPLWGVIRDALKQGHKGPICLFHGGQTIKDLYLVDELRALADKHEQFRYYPCIDGVESVDIAGQSKIFYEGRVQEKALECLPDLKGWGIYLCGNPAMVNDAKRKTFLAGAALAEIHADPFVTPFSG